MPDHRLCEQMAKVPLPAPPGPLTPLGMNDTHPTTELGVAPKH